MNLIQIKRFHRTLFLALSLQFFSRVKFFAFILIFCTLSNSSFATTAEPSWVRAGDIVDHLLAREIPSIGDFNLQKFRQQIGSEIIWASVLPEQIRKDFAGARRSAHYPPGHVYVSNQLPDLDSEWVALLELQEIGNSRTEKSGTEVYDLAAQLFPLTQNES